MPRTLLWYSTLCCAHPFSRAGVCVCHVTNALPARTPSLRERDTYISERETFTRKKRTERIQSTVCSPRRIPEIMLTSGDATASA